MAEEKKFVKPEEDRDERLAALVARAVADATVKVQERISPIEKREPSLVSPYNPEGLKVRPRLTRRVIFAGAEMKEKFMSNREIELVNRLPDEGRFNKGAWKLRTRLDGDDKKTLFIDLGPVNDINHRMTLPHSLTALVNQILSEAEQPVAAK